MRVERRVRLSRGRFVAALVLLLLLPLATMVPALAALALVTAVWLALHTYELVWWRRRAHARCSPRLRSSQGRCRPLIEAASLALTSDVLYVGGSDFEG